MSIYLIKNKNGTFSPLDSSDFEAANSIPPGSVVKAEKARNYRFLKKFFALVNVGFSSQEKYKSSEVYRKVLLIRAGYFEQVEGKDGQIHYFPQSLAFDKMSEEVFEKVFNSVLDIISADMDTAPEIIKKEIEGFY